MNRNQLKSLARDIALVVLGVALSVLWTEFKQWRTKTKEHMNLPKVFLDQAQKARLRFTESDFRAAEEGFKALIELVDKDQSLDQATKRMYEAKAYSGLSRTYADWATLRSWRGLKRGNYPQSAEDQAQRALNIDHEMPEANIALAYALDSEEPSESTTSTIKGKVKELVEKKVDGLDTKYLDWLYEFSKEGNPIPSEIRPEQLSDNMRMLLDIAGHFETLARIEPTKKQMHLSRCEEFLARAAYHNQNNAMLLFQQGHLAATREQTAVARDYYRKAVEQETAFPKARHNWGFTYAVEGDYRNAKEQFEAAIQDKADAPPISLRRWLDNLGYVSLEIKDRNRACQAWKEASGIAGASEDPRAFLGLAMCHYVEGRKDEAVIAFRRSVALAQKLKESGRNSQIDPSDIHWYESEKDGPKELQIAKALIRMYKQTPTGSTPNKSS